MPKDKSENKIKEIPLNKQRIVLYARKSTEDETNQVNSIRDQVTRCKEVAERMGLNIVEVITEEKSARKAGNRPRFDEMIRGFPDKYDGILAWAPDRLSRNMREAGVIIDMYNPDNYEIKSLVFANGGVWDSSSHGLLSLAISFSMATHYSDSLSENVKRGVNGQLLMGKSSGMPKWGYYRNDITGYYEPDQNFSAIQAGWKMLLDGHSQREIVDYWKENNVRRLTKRSNKSGTEKWQSISSSTASRLFQDSFYCGLLQQAGQEVNLCEVVPGFKPMITREEFCEAQHITGERYGKTIRTAKKANFYPLRGMVKCGVCGGTMVVGASRARSGKKILYFRCDNKACTRSQRSIRAKDVFNQIETEVSRVSFSKRDYDLYSEQLKKYSGEIIADLRSRKRSLIGEKTALKAHQADIARKYAELAGNGSKTPQSVLDTLRNDMEVNEDKIRGLDQKIDDLDERIGDPSKLALSEDEFLNLVNNMAHKMKIGTPKEKDLLCRILFLNLQVDNEKTLSYLWKEPFDSIANCSKIPSGGREGT